LYDDKNVQKHQYALRTGPSAKEKTKKFFGLSPVREMAENESQFTAIEVPRQVTDEERQVIDEGQIIDEGRRVIGKARQVTNEERSGPTEPDDEEDEEIPELSLSVAIILLVVVTTFVAFTAEWLVDSIDGLASGGGISKEFIGLILLPIVGNAAEHVTAVTVSVKDRLTLSLGVAVGSSIVSSLPSPIVSAAACNILDSLPLQQIALFVIPFIVTLGWIIGRPLTMLFDPFESIVLFFSVLTVNYVVQGGKSNWFEGMILTCLCVLTFLTVTFLLELTRVVLGRRYVIVALVFWFYPGAQLDGLLTCSA
jgi:Ca2+:H+ antiporter